MSKDKCDRCYEDYEWINTDKELYKYEDKLYCWKCLERKLEEDDEILRISTLIYFDSDGKYIGDNNDIEEVIDRIVDSLDIEVIKNE